MMRVASEQEVRDWDLLVASNPDHGNPLQSRAFAATKATAGWKPHYVIYDLDGTKIATLYLTRHVVGLGELWYAPKGPGVDSAEQLQQIVQANAQLRRPFLIKLEPELAKSTRLAIPGLVKAKREIQYNHATVIVDLAPSEEEILASFKQKTRYNVRLAEKKGVVVEAVPTNSATMKAMYAMMQSTQERAGFFLRSYDYFENFWKLHAGTGSGQMFQTTFEGQALASAFISYLGTKALYKDGGSIREHSELQAPYLMQWRMMQWLKAHGVLEYDLHGTPPADEIDNPGHPLAGLARFKTGFRAEVTEYVGTLDQIIKPTRYRLWQAGGERLAVGYASRAKRQLFY